MSTYVDVEISPEMTTRPVFTSVSQATRPVGSSRSTASRIPSEIWSAILSGWPSVTDSDVNRYSLSLKWLMESRGSLRVGNKVLRACAYCAGRGGDERNPSGFDVFGGYEPRSARERFLRSTK